MGFHDFRGLETELKMWLGPLGTQLEQFFTKLRRNLLTWFPVFQPGYDGAESSGNQSVDAL